MRDHTKLKVFEMADEVALMVYRITADFPKAELYGLTSQVRTAAISVPSNIVEGCARDSQADYRNRKGPECLDSLLAYRLIAFSLQPSAFKRSPP